MAYSRNNNNNNAVSFEIAIAILWVCDIRKSIICLHISRIAYRARTHTHTRSAAIRKQCAHFFFDMHGPTKNALMTITHDSLTSDDRSCQYKSRNSNTDHIHSRASSRSTDISASSATKRRSKRISITFHHGRWSKAQPQRFGLRSTD